MKKVNFIFCLFISLASKAQSDQKIDYYEWNRSGVKVETRLTQFLNEAYIKDYIFNHKMRLEEIDRVKKSAKGEGIYIDISQLNFDTAGKLVSIEMEVRTDKKYIGWSSDKYLKDDTYYGVRAFFRDSRIDSIELGRFKKNNK